MEMTKTPDKVFLAIQERAAYCYRQPFLFIAARKGKVAFLDSAFLA